jgi:arsenate reductase-like glutaredoxin family protein
MNELSNSINDVVKGIYKEQERSEEIRKESQNIANEKLKHILDSVGDNVGSLMDQQALSSDKLSEILNREDKNPTLVEYGQDSICRPTVAGFQELYDLKYENPNEKYYWNYKQCKWITESEQDSIIEAVFNEIAEDMIEEEGYLDGEKD